MAGSLGHLATIFAFALAAIGTVAAFVGGRTGRESLVKIARDMGLAVFGFVLLACLAMEYALVTHDFSVEYVAQVGSRATPLFFTVISLWSALEGSILLWALILSAYTVAVVMWTRRRPADDRLSSYTLGTLLSVSVFFLLLIVGPANPFETMSPVPEDGPGPNALLQNHWFMGVHPPLLYTGYVGMAVPFSLAVAGLLVGRIDRDWSRIVRRWTLFPWMFLTLGIVAGAWWSYEVLGWGGYWAWDPVENASFMPWLVGTAFLHSVMVQERRNMLKIWTLSLIITTFLLTILGTFLTRSGIIASVHAFTQGAIGPFFLGYLAVVLIASLALLAWRSTTLETEGRLDSPLSRETAFLVNNLLFAAFTFVVLLGTMFPLVAEAIQGARVSVGAPFFNQMNVPIGLALIFLVGVGPALPWGSAAPGIFRRKFLWPTVASLAVGAVLFALGVRDLFTWLTFVFVVFAALVLGGEFLIPTRARRRSLGESWGRALAAVCLNNRRRYGGYVVHYGVLMVAIGIAASSSYRHEVEWSANPERPETVGAYTIQLDSVWAVQEPQRDAVIAAVTVFSDGRRVDRMFPRINYYPNSVQPIGTPAVREGLKEDLYLVLSAYAADGSQTTLKAIISPLVIWIWVGGVTMGLGALFAMWPGRKKPSEQADRDRSTAAAGRRRKRELAETAEAGT